MKDNTLGNKSLSGEKNIYGMYRLDYFSGTQ